MKIGIIGAGKVGVSMGKFFVEGGLCVSGFYSRTKASALEAANFTNTNFYEELSQIVKESDILFLTVPDGQIKTVYEQIGAFELYGKQICHCSGAMSAQEAFVDIDKKGAYGFSIHPLFPVSSKYETYKELSKAFFCIEGNTTPSKMQTVYKKEWEERLKGLGASVRSIEPEKKIKYHAACAISSNLVCALIQESLDLLMDCGFDEKEAILALAPLIRSNIEHVIEVGPLKALTGPMERGDKATVLKHIECFESNLEKEIYISVSKKLMEVAKNKHPERSYDQMNHILEQG